MQKRQPSERLSLVLNAGGARGAYQAGVLKRIGEISSLKNAPSPFPIVSGASVGALNGAAIAAGSSHFGSATNFLHDIWSTIDTPSVYRTDVFAFGKTGYQLARDFSLGKPSRSDPTLSLLDAQPLREFLGRKMPFEMIQSNIREGHLYALAVAATNYFSGKNTIFIQGKENHPVWEKKRRVAFATKITLEHLMASTAIPLLFSPVRVGTPSGDYYFGDGGLRLVHPLSASIRLGAKKLLAIGIRCQNNSEARNRSEMTQLQADRWYMRPPSFAHVMGVIMNSIFLDHIDSDVEHLMRMNEIMKSLNPCENPTAREGDLTLSVISPLVINPSFDIAVIAKQYLKQLPKTVRYVLEALGGTEFGSADLMSYINFDRAYTQDLLELGYHDAEQKIEEIEHFIRS